MPVVTEHPGVAVRRLLEESGLSVIDAAQRLQVSRSQLQRLLGKQSGVSPDMALRIASVFGVDARELLHRQTAHDLDRASRRARNDLKKLSPFSGPLRRRNKAHVREVLRRRERQLRERGIDHLFLFGSVARDAAKPGSDIDLCYHEAPGRSIGLIEIGKIEEELSELLGAPVDLAAQSALRPGVRDGALRDAIKIF